jgi:hypothetical protein
MFDWLKKLISNVETKSVTTLTDIKSSISKYELAVEDLEKRMIDFANSEIAKIEAELKSSLGDYCNHFETTTTVTNNENHN